jgi:glutamate racemase
VIEPSCQEALKISQSKKIGLMATQATVDGGQYHKLIPPPYELYAQSCPLLVPLVESGWTEDPITEAIVKRYVEPLIKKNVDVIILGCTHFPILKQVIQKAIGPKITLVDPGESLADQLKKTQTSTAVASELKIFLTDKSPHFVQLAKNLLSSDNLKITQVDLDTVS